MHQKKTPSGTIPFSLLPGVTSWVWIRASFIPEFKTFRTPQRWDGRGGTLGLEKQTSRLLLSTEFPNWGPCALEPVQTCREHSGSAGTAARRWPRAPPAPDCPVPAREIDVSSQGAREARSPTPSRLRPPRRFQRARPR